MHVRKERLPRRLSYPVQTGMIATALEEAGIALDCSVRYHNNLRTGFTAYFWPPNPNVPFERLYVTIGAIASEEASEARLRMRASVLPAFVAWICKIASRRVV